MKLQMQIQFTTTPYPVGEEKRAAIASMIISSDKDPVKGQSLSLSQL